MTRRSGCAVCAPAPTTTSGLSRPLEVSVVTRSSVTLSWLAPTSNGGAEIVALVIGRSRAPVAGVDARGAGLAAGDRRCGRQPGRADRLPIPRLRLRRERHPPASATRSVPYNRPVVTFSSRHRTFSESKPVTFTSYCHVVKSTTSSTL